MEKNKNREEMAALLRSLSSADRAWLRQRLMRRDSAALLQDYHLLVAFCGWLASVLLLLR